MSKLAARLEEICGRDEALRALRAQWNQDEPELSRALQSVGGMYPHYSRHDGSHSAQILRNVEKILGDERN